MRTGAIILIIAMLSAQALANCPANCTQCGSDMKCTSCVQYFTVFEDRCIERFPRGTLAFLLICLAFIVLLTVFNLLRCIFFPVETAKPAQAQPAAIHGSQVVEVKHSHTYRIAND